MKPRKPCSDNARTYTFCDGRDLELLELPRPDSQQVRLAVLDALALGGEAVLV